MRFVKALGKYVLLSNRVHYLECGLFCRDARLGQTLVGGHIWANKSLWSLRNKPTKSWRSVAIEPTDSLQAQIKRTVWFVRYCELLRDSWWSLNQVFKPLLQHYSNKQTNKQKVSMIGTQLTNKALRFSPFKKLITLDDLTSCRETNFSAYLTIIPRARVGYEVINNNKALAMITS